MRLALVCLLGTASLLFSYVVVVVQGRGTKHSVDKTIDGHKVRQENATKKTRKIYLIALLALWLFVSCSAIPRKRGKKAKEEAAGLAGLEGVQEDEDPGKEAKHNGGKAVAAAALVGLVELAEVNTTALPHLYAHTPSISIHTQTLLYPRLYLAAVSTGKADPSQEEEEARKDAKALCTILINIPYTQYTCFMPLTLEGSSPSSPSPPFLANTEVRLM